MNLLRKSLVLSLQPNVKLNKTRPLSNIARQNEIFNEEQKRQKDLVGRVEKIEIEYDGPPEKTTLVMNKNVSSPYDCAKHLGELHTKRSAVALLNETTLWHMHKPLPDSCKLQLLHYTIPQPHLVNRAYWRTCSFILGAIINNAFKDNIEVQLHSFPSPNVKSGSFVYDAQLSIDDWIPTDKEMKVLSLEMKKFCAQNHPIHCLDVSVNIAFDIFKNNPHKTKQIPDIAANNGNKVTLYRVHNHIDISKGPMVTDTSHMGRVTVANVIKLKTDIEGGPIYRFQGVSLPSSIILDHFAYSLLEERAKELNAAKIPGSQVEINEDESFVNTIPV